MNSITEVTSQVNLLHLRVFDRKGEWQIEAIFEGGAKVTGWLSADTVTDLESDFEAQGWQVEPSLFCAGFNAKPPVEDELIFASGIEWADDYALEGVRL